jgi:hypothetical protein
MDLGDTPDIIHPSRKQAVLQGTHPLGSHPALPRPHQPRLATHGYKQAMSQVQRYTGRMPRNAADLMRCSMEMFSALQKIQGIEAEHKEELEKLAISTVLQLPKFKSLRGPVSRKEIILQAELNPEIDIKGAKMSDEEPDPEPEEMNVPEIRHEIDAEAEKRRLINALIQGSAVSDNYAFAYYSRDALQRIDPELVQDYGKLMSLTEIGYWATDDATVRAAAAAGGSEAQGGESRLSQDEQGRPVIIAKASGFPFLVHELVKGIMEYLSFDDTNDPDTRKLAYKKADFIDDETWSMLMGPGIWKNFLDAVGLDNHEVIPYLFDEINQMPLNEFYAFVRDLVEGGPRSKQQLAKMAAEVRQDIKNDEGQAESQAWNIAGDLLD